MFFSRCINTDQIKFMAPNDSSGLVVIVIINHFWNHRVVFERLQNRKIVLCSIVFFPNLYCQIFSKFLHTEGKEIIAFLHRSVMFLSKFLATFQNSRNIEFVLWKVFLKLTFWNNLGSQNWRISLEAKNFTVGRDE